MLAHNMKGQAQIVTHASNCVRGTATLLRPCCWGGVEVNNDMRGEGGLPGLLPSEIIYKVSPPRFSSMCY